MVHTSFDFFSLFFLSKFLFLKFFMLCLAERIMKAHNRTLKTIYHFRRKKKKKYLPLG